MSPTDRALTDLDDALQIIATARVLRDVPLSNDQIAYAWAHAIQTGQLTEAQVTRFGKVAIEREELRQDERWHRIRRAFG